MPTHNETSQAATSMRHIEKSEYNEMRKERI